jgi:hypothetical protein
LNREAHGQAALPALELSSALKRALNHIEAAAMDDTGQHVDYAALRRSAAYATYRTELTPQLRQVDLRSLATRSEQLAFWINLYNGLIIDAAITFGVRQSVQEVRGGIVAFFRRAAYNVGGYRFSANDIEHGILRANRPHWAIPGPQLGPGDPRLAWGMNPMDPRIHCALNCASRSCPPIAFYDAGRIEMQLDLAAASFVAGAVSVEPAANTVHLSRIFKWYAHDFEPVQKPVVQPHPPGNSGFSDRRFGAEGRRGVLDFVLRYLPAGRDQAWLAAHGLTARFVYQPYDWRLNG